MLADFVTSCYFSLLYYVSKKFGTKFVQLRGGQPQ